MNRRLRSPQNRFVFGDAHDWVLLAPEDWRQLHFSAVVRDQIFSIFSARTAAALFFELTVSEQCPKDTYARIAKSLAVLPAEYLVISIGHARNAGIHLIFWRKLQPKVFHHLDLDPTHPSHFDLALVEDVQTPSPRRLRRLFDRMDQQSLSQTFFITLRNQLKKVRCSNDNSYYALVDLLLKLIFLIFVQRKGWLNFDPYYLESKMAACSARGLSIVSFLFKPLFAQLEGMDAACEIPLGALPRLGGGLFHFKCEHLPRLENEWVCDLYRTLVSQFSFSLFEAIDGRKVLGISPEVLGHVFENLLIEDDRKNHGAYYTPMDIAEKQVRASLKAWRSHNCPDVKDWRDALPDLRILDPSCGSGTYLVAAFSVILQNRLEFLPEAERSNGRLFALKRQIVLNNLYGVDIHPMAIKLAEVRLWLNMIQDLEISEPSQAPSLPNLRHHLRPGDFLSRHLPKAATRLKLWPKYERLEALRTQFPDSNPETRSIVLHQIFRMEDELELWLIDQQDREEIARVKSRLAQPCLPGQELFNTAVAFESSPSHSSLLHVVFSKVFLEGGFHLILGNPPWLRSSGFKHGQKENILRNLEAPPGLHLRGQVDLSLYFTSASLNLLKPKGHLSFLLPAKIINARYAAELRAWLMRYCTLDYLLDYGIHHRLLFQAVTFPIAIGVTRSEAPVHNKVAIERYDQKKHAAYSLMQKDMGEGRGVWIIDRPQNVKGMDTWQRLADFEFTVHRGIVTGSKSHFTFKSMPTHLTREQVQPLLRGRDIQQERARPGGWIYWPFGLGANWFERLSAPERKWLESTGELQQKGALCWLKYKPRILGRWVLIWKYLAKTWEVALMRGDTWIPDQTTYYINFLDFATAFRFFAYFHSDVAQHWLRSVAERGKDQCFFYYAHTVKSLPIPPNLKALPFEIPPERELAPEQGRGLWKA